MFRFHASAFKHGISHLQIDDVLRSEYTEVFDEGFDAHGHQSAMFVGFDSGANLLEVKLKVVNHPSRDLEMFHVFHAQRATHKYSQLFNERKGK